MAKLFGYASYEEQLKHLNKIEKHKILQHELLEQAKDAAGADDVPMVEDEEIEMEMEEEEGEEDTKEAGSGQPESSAAANEQPVDDRDEAMATSVQPDAPVSNSTVVAVSADMQPVSTVPSAREPNSSSPVGRRRTAQRIPVDNDDEDDGNDADSEQDGKEDDDAKNDEDDDSFNLSPNGAGAGAGDKSPAPPKDRAAAYRRLLQEEARQTKLRKRLKQRGDFVEAEAEEDEEEDVLKIGGLGDFGFGVPQAKTQESKEAEEERKALELREDDLDGIVDDLSDDEREQAKDLEELFRKELEDQDRHQLKEVMRNVKEGFGRNRRAFSSSVNGAEARGRFNLDELVAADGKLEAARLGLLESDEELSDSGEATRATRSKAKKKAKKKVNDEDEEEDEENEEDENEEEDEEAEMERMLRERFTNQPKIYITSSESEDDDDDAARDALKNAGGAADNDAESDDERERQQMKLFSERARVNRRMQRMKEMQRQVAEDAGVASAQSHGAVVSNLLLEEDEDAQEVRWQRPHSWFE